MRLSPVVLALLTLAATPLAAQWDTTTAFGRVVQRRFAEIAPPDSALRPGETQHSGPLVRWMSDSTVIDYTQFNIEFYRRVSPRECFLAFAAPDGAADLFRLMQLRSDSSDAERLAGYIALAGRNLTEREPAQLIASATQVQKMMRGMLSHASPKEGRFIRKQVMTQPGKTCVLIPWVLRRLVGKSPARIAPVLRMMLAP